MAPKLTMAEAENSIEATRICSQFPAKNYGRREEEEEKDWEEQEKEKEEEEEEEEEAEHKGRTNSSRPGDPYEAVCYILNNLTYSARCWIAKAKAPPHPPGNNMKERKNIHGKIFKTKHEVDYKCQSQFTLLRFFQVNKE